MAGIDGRLLWGAVPVAGRACSVTSVVGRPYLVIANFYPLLLGGGSCRGVRRGGRFGASRQRARPAR